MSKGTFFGNILRDPVNLALGPIGMIKEAVYDTPRDKAKTAKANSERDSAAATSQALAKVEAEAQAVDKRQKAKQYAATNTTSKGFGSNSKENLSRSFLLRL